MLGWWYREAATGDDLIPDPADQTRQRPQTALHHDHIGRQPSPTTNPTLQILHERQTTRLEDRRETDVVHVPRANPGTAAESDGWGQEIACAAGTAAAADEQGVAVFAGVGERGSGGYGEGGDECYE